MLLEKTEILIVDCQATGANPQNGHLIEIGWMRCQPDEKGTFASIGYETHLIQLPEDIDIPKRVQQVTGISPEDLNDSVSQADAWARLIQTAGTVAQANGTAQCLTIIHFAKYETPFLRFLHHQFASDGLFPFEIMCTHEIAKRLLPGLPRKGLRAVAGYFGFSTSEKRRCGHHLKATLSIWNREVEMFKKDHDVQTVDDLILWLERTEQNRKHCRVYPMDRKLRLKLPDVEGLYRFRRSNKDLLYIGKARSLKSRVNSYFQQNRKQPEHILEMLSQACGIDYTVTDSAVEAAVIESDEIKTFSPPYNIALKHRDRKIGFSSRDFRNQATKPDNAVTLGPLPSPDTLVPLSLLSELSASRDAQAKDVSTVLNIPDEYAPALLVFREGLAEFIQRYETELRPNSLFRNFIRLGAMFWKKRLEAADGAILEEDDLIEEGIDEIEGEEWEWTPDAVANAVEGVVRRSVHLIRRARWFCLLSESSLVWERRQKEISDRNVLEFHKGKLVRKGILNDGEPTPVPSGYQRSTLLRQRSFNVMTYDRMRVVTTEIRRLLSEGRDVELCLRPNTLLKHKSLKRFLLWV